MSSDDLIFIYKNGKPEGEYVAQHQTASGGIIKEIGRYRNLREAVKGAQKYMDEWGYPIEYGMRFSGNV